MSQIQLGGLIVHMSEYYDDDIYEETNEGINDLFPLYPSEAWVYEKIGNIIRSRIAYCSPDEIVSLARLLYALERIPYSTPGLFIDLSFSSIYRINGGYETKYYLCLDFSDNSFRLSKAIVEYTPKMGSDSSSTTIFEMELGGYRDGNFEVKDWLSDFQSYCEDKDSNLSISDGSDGDMDLTEDIPSDGWKRLEKYLKEVLYYD